MEIEKKLQLILKIAKKLHDKNVRTGTTFIQKVLYFLIKSENIPFGYDYTLYDYGPYSFELTKDINSMEYSRMIIKEPDPSGYGFKIYPNPKMDTVKKFLNEYTEYDAKIDKIIEKFKGIPANHMGLIATFRFVYDELKKEKSEKEITDSEIIELVSQIKPMFNQFQYEYVLSEYAKIIKE